MPGNIEVWQIFIGCFMPGFVAIKVYGLYRAIDARDFSKKWYDAVGYGIVFFTIYQVIGKSLIGCFMKWFPYDFVPMGIQLVFFILLPAWAARFMAKQGYCYIEKNEGMLMPQETAWDYIFSKSECYYVIIHLKDGNVIAGEYAERSFSTSYPQEKQIFIEKQFLVDENGNNPRRIDSSAGIWISGNDISWIDFRFYNP